MPAPTSHQRVAANLALLCSPTRVNILRALSKVELAAGDLALVVDRSPSATSQHLRVLRDAGVVLTRRDGNVVRYRLRQGALAETLTEIALRVDVA